MSDHIDIPVFTLRYGDIELVIAEDTLTRKSAPFTIITPSSKELDHVEDIGLLAAFQSEFSRLEEVVPKSIPMLRAYATLIMFYRISKNPDMNLSYEQAKAKLMGENAEDTLLFIVAKLLRTKDDALRGYLRQPHILFSSLLKVKQEFILGEGNVLRLFQEAQAECTKQGVDRLSLKQFTTLYERMDPLAATNTASPAMPVPVSALSEGKESKEEEKAAPDVVSEGQDDGAIQTRSRSAGQSQSASSSSSSSKASAPVYRSSSSSRKRAKTTTTDAECVNCHGTDRPSKLMLCDRVDCETACHYDCCDPPLSAVPKGSWFCAACKVLVKQALDEELSLLVMPPDNEEEKNDEEKGESHDEVEEISAEQWRQEQERWRRDREQYEKALAAKDAEVEQLRAEVERFKRQRLEREEHPMEEERKEQPVEQTEAEHKDPAEDEQKERPKTSTPSNRRRGHAR